ncbi:MAG: hypothetical protein CVU64_15885 [Deltaproteobacteria bacterium HGW-Deltaproteobacteria-21]|nr:MAG: hypothetical protein CVU64_15885 [Deltaproteobacteria bacterium HGW-Deltaproteobacteria-21]
MSRQDFSTGVESLLSKQDVCRKLFAANFPGSGIQMRKKHFEYDFGERLWKSLFSSTRPTEPGQNFSHELR